MGFSDSEFRDHVTRQHADSSNVQEVVSGCSLVGVVDCLVSMEICPVCAAYPGGNPNHQTRDFSGHLMLDHSLTLRDADLISILYTCTVQLVISEGEFRQFLVIVYLVNL